MAFFSDGSNEYFSLNLDPVKNAGSFVYRLTKAQISVSQYWLPRLLLMSVAIFMAVVAISGFEYFDLVEYYINAPGQEFLVVSLAGGATLIAFLEVLFFFWIKKNKLISSNLIISKGLMKFSMLINKSWMVYLIFLLNMLVPFIALLALPGGLSELFSEIYDYGSAYGVFLIQLGATLIIFSAFLLRRVAFLLCRT